MWYSGTSQRGQIHLVQLCFFGKGASGQFPFCTIEPNLGSTQVPDTRLEELAALVHPGRIVPATVDFVDIASLVKGASKGEGLGNQFLANIRETDAILHILRCFDHPDVVHVDGSVDPVRDKEIIDTELQLNDLETVENRIAKVQKQAVTGGDKQAAKLAGLLLRYRDALRQGKNARTVLLTNQEEEQMSRELFLLTNKPVLYVCNVDENSAQNGNDYTRQVAAALLPDNEPYLIVAGRIESEIAQLDTYQERQMFLEDLGLDESGVSRLIKAAFRLLDLETYFTAGPMEVKAWTYIKGTKAPQAAGLIHSDFEHGFIRAEVIKFEDYIRYGSEAACREAGKLAVEGKNYVVQDGDIMHFLFSR